MLLQRLQNFLSKPIADPGLAALYNACIVQGRQADFYRILKVPDTIDGRFDLLVLHVFLVMRRLDDTTKQQLFDLMFADMDRNLREMGVGDMGIGKRMKRMIGAFYGRAQAYEKALSEDPASLALTLKRNVYGDATIESDLLMHIVTYVNQIIIKLEKRSTADLLSGHVEFPELVHS